MKMLSQKTVYRLVMILAACTFILANLSVGKLGRFYGLTLDFTGERLYSLSVTTKNVLSELQSQTVIYVISDESSYQPTLNEILRRYGSLSPMITIQYVDPYKDPVFLNHYSGQGFQLKESDLLVTGSKGIRHIPYADIFRRYNYGRASGLFLEEKLTNAILNVNSSRRFSASFTVGHGENPTVLKEALSDSGFTTENLVLMAGEIPKTDVVIITGPERDFLAEETAVLGNFLEGGGRLMLFMGPAAYRLPELENFLSSWDLSLLPGIVLESIAHTSGNPASVIPLYGMHEINMNFAERQYYLAMPGTRAVEPLEHTDDVVITRLLLSTRDSYTKTGTNYSSSRNPGDITGPFVLAAAAEKSNGKLMLFGSKGIFAEDIINEGAYANREYLTRAVLWLAGGQEYESVSIPPKSIAAPKINSGFGVVLASLSIFAVILPLTVLTAGVITLLKRRRR